MKTFKCHLKTCLFPGLTVTKTKQTVAISNFISNLGRGPRRGAVAHVRGLSVGRSVDRCVGASLCPLHCGKTADRIRLPCGIIGRTGPGIRQVVRFGDRSTGRGTFGGEFGARHCNQWGLYRVRVRQRRDAALFPNYFKQTCYFYYRPTVCNASSVNL